MFKEIEPKEYFELYKKHRANLCVHSSYTDMEGMQVWSGGTPQWMTEWGFKDSDAPLIRAETKRIDGVDTHKYFLYCV